MPGGPGTHVPVAATGTTTFVASTPIKFDLSQLSSLQGPPPRKTYLRQLTLNVAIALTADNSGNITVPVAQLFTIFTSFILQMQGHQFFNLPYQGGASIRQMNFIMFGKLPKISASTWTWNASQAATTLGWNPEVSYVFPFYDPRGISQEDGLVPVGVLVGTYLLATWCAAGALGTHLTISTVNTKVRNLTADLIQRDEVRFPALSCWEERQQSGKADFITPEGNLYTDVHMVAATAAGTSAAGFTAANLTNVVYTSQGGLKTQDNLDPRDLINAYNAQQGLSSEGMIADWLSGTSDIVPVQYWPRSSGRLTHIVPELNKPYLQLTGAISPTADFFMLLHYLKPSGPKTLADLAAKANQPLPAGFADDPRKFMFTKGASVAQPTVPAGKSQFLPVQVVLPAAA